MLKLLINFQCPFDMSCMGQKSLPFIILYFQCLEQHWAIEFSLRFLAVI